MLSLSLSTTSVLRRVLSRAAAEPLILDQIGAPSAAAYSLRKLRAAYTGSAIRVRRSSDNAEADIGFATAAQTRTNLAAIPINNNGGSTAPGVTMTTLGTGTEFGQPYVEVRWQGTASAAGFLQFNHGAGGAFNPTIHAPVTPGLTYTTSIGFRLVSGTMPSGALVIRGSQYNNAGGFLGGTGVSVGPVTSTLWRGGAIIVAALANAAFISPNIYMSVNNGEVVDVTIRFYAANVEQAIGNARPLLQRNVPETIADIGDLDTAALLSFVGGGSGFVTTWYDQSGNARNATQTTAGAQPQIVSNGVLEAINGKPEIRFDGANDYLAAASPLIDTTHSLFVLFRPTIENQTGSVFGQWSAGQAGRFLFDANQNSGGITEAGKLNPFNSTATAGGGSGGGAGYAADVAISNTPTLITSISTTGTEQWKLFKNGTQWDSATITSVYTGVNSAIGSSNATGSLNPFDGTVSELISFPSVLSTTDRQTLETNQGAYYGISLLALDQLTTPSAAAYSSRKLRAAYTGNAIRVRRSSDNAELDIGFATAVQTRTNLAAIPINNNGGTATTGLTMTTLGTGIEFGQSYIDVRWQGTSTSTGGFGSQIIFAHGATGAFNPTIHAPFVFGSTYTTSVGFRLIAGAAPSSNPRFFVKFYGSDGALVGAKTLQDVILNSTLQRATEVYVGNEFTAYTQPNFLISIPIDEVVDCTIRFYAANVEQGIGNARPLLQRNVPETIADIGDIDANALLAHIAGPSATSSDYSDGFVTTWYDQSGNGRNATQTTAGSQPRIVNSGAIETQNGLPVVSFDGTNILNTPSFILGDTVVTVARRSATNQPVVEGANVGSGDRGLWGLRSGSTDFTTHLNYGINGGPLNATNAAGFPINVLQIVSQTAAKGAVATTASIWGIGGGSSGYVQLDGFISELISFSSVLSTANRQTLERNQGDYYTISVS